MKGYITRLVFFLSRVGYRHRDMMQLWIFHAVVFFVDSSHILCDHSPMCPVYIYICVSISDYQICRIMFPPKRYFWPSLLNSTKNTAKFNIFIRWCRVNVSVHYLTSHLKSSYAWSVLGGSRLSPTKPSIEDILSGITDLLHIAWNEAKKRWKITKDVRKLLLKYNNPWVHWKPWA